MDDVYRGWVGGMGVGGGWETEGRQYHPQGGKQQCYVFSRAQNLLQSTWLDETVVSSSLTPQAYWYLQAGLISRQHAVLPN